MFEPQSIAMYNTGTELTDMHINGVTHCTLMQHAMCSVYMDG